MNALPSGTVTFLFTDIEGSTRLAREYAGQFRDDVLTGQARCRDIVDVARVARLFDEHRRGAADHSFALWAVWMFERWARHEPALRLRSEPAVA